MKTIDLEKALHGLHYDLGEKLRTDNNPADTWRWLQMRVEHLSRDLEMFERVRESNREANRRYYRKTHEDLPEQ